MWWSVSLVLHLCHNTGSQILRRQLRHWSIDELLDFVFICAHFRGEPAVELDVSRRRGLVEHGLHRFWLHLIDSCRLVALSMVANKLPLVDHLIRQLLLLLELFHLLTVSILFYHGVSIQIGIIMEQLILTMWLLELARSLHRCCLSLCNAKIEK